MSELFHIEKITVGADKLSARVTVRPNMPIMTSEDIEATARVYYLAPAIAKHLCLGDTGREFQDCMSDTEVAHLLEHLSVEIMRETGLAGNVSCGRTRRAPGEDRTFEVELSCPDDALTVGALSSATFMMDWAFLHADAQAPDFPGTVKALRNLVLGLRGEHPADEEPADEASTAPSVIDTEGAQVADSHDGPAPVFGGAAAVDAAHAGVSQQRSDTDPSATVQMGALAEDR